MKSLSQFVKAPRMEREKVGKKVAAGVDACRNTLVFCMNCGHILAPDKHHADCPTRKGREWKDGKWRPAERRT
jgi:ribosomal protein L32